MTTHNLRWMNGDFGTYTLKINNYTLIVTTNNLRYSWIISNDLTNEIEDSSYRSKKIYTEKSSRKKNTQDDNSNEIAENLNKVKMNVINQYLRILGCHSIGSHNGTSD